MKRIVLCFVIVLQIVLCSNTIFAQTPTDAVMMKRREACLAIIYDHGSFDQYYEGSWLRKNGTIAKVTRNTLMPMIAIGIHDKLNLIVSAPYVRTKSSEPNGGRFEGAKGFQDIGITLKAELLNTEIGPGKLVGLVAAGYATPMTNYLSDYMPYSLGLGTNEVSGRAIVHYRFNMGLYARATGSYLWRGQTEAERDYYYNNGSYYTAWMDVPSAWSLNTIVGMSLLDNALKIETGYTGLWSTSGDDIRPYNAPQPTNRTEFGQLSLSAQYYFPADVLKGFGLLVAYSNTLSGRNAAKIQNVSGGVTYQFKF